jgi:hypothetical protein
VNPPYYNKKGGPDGVQACVESCPANSLRVINEMPDQSDLRGGGDQQRGYDRNLQPPPKPKAAPKPKESAAEAPGGN